MRHTLFLTAFTLLIVNLSNAQGRKCVGSSSCSACTTCSGCQHCAKDGGTCGVCSSAKHIPSTTPKKKAPAVEKKSFPVATSPSNPNTTTEINIIYVVAATSLNLRSGAGESYSVITPLEYGTELIALTTNGTWWKVKVVKSGLIGYVHSSYIKGKP